MTVPHSLNSAKRDPCLIEDPIDDAAIDPVILNCVYSSGVGGAAPETELGDQSWVRRPLRAVDLGDHLRPHDHTDDTPVRIQIEPKSVARSERDVLSMVASQLAEVGRSQLVGGLDQSSSSYTSEDVYRLQVRVHSVWGRAWMPHGWHFAVESRRNSR